MNGRLGRKWFQEAFDGNDLKPRKYRIRMASFLSRLVGRLGALSCRIWLKSIFHMLIYLYGRFFCKILSFEQPCHQYSHVKVTIYYRYNILRVVRILNIRKQ